MYRRQWLLQPSGLGAFLLTCIRRRAVKCLSRHEKNAKRQSRPVEVAADKQAKMRAFLEGFS
jgi:hypothetical protein